MGVYPYITAQIILQLLVPDHPGAAAHAWKKTRARAASGWNAGPTILAVPMAALQAIGQISIFQQFAGGRPILNFGHWA